MDVCLRCRRTTTAVAVLIVDEMIGGPAWWRSSGPGP